MQIHQFDNVQKFWENAQGYLLENEAEHNALLGILQTLLHHPESFSTLPYLATVQANDTILAIAIRMPARSLLLSKARDLNALKLIAQDLRQEPLPGVMGLVAEAEAFVQAWQSLTGQPCQVDFESRLYQLTQVESVASPGGHLRLATESDRPVLVEWFTAFNAAIGMASTKEMERRVDLELKRQSSYLWDDGVPVSLAGGRSFSATAARIAPVYTPPEHRRRGYATACVAALSQRLLDQGCNRCFLFTDLANPTSNRIYQQIGYRPLCDYYEYSFLPKAQP